MRLSIVGTSYFEFGSETSYVQRNNQVFELAAKCVAPLVDKIDETPAYLIAATTCPDSIAPTLGQKLSAKFATAFSNVHIVDMVQGCAGGVESLILGSKLAMQSHGTVVVVASDAAHKAVSPGNPHVSTFGNGAAAFLIKNQNLGGINFIYSKSQHYEELTEVVTIKLGHDAGSAFQSGSDFLNDPREYLGLRINDGLAIKLLKKTESFYRDFVAASEKPDVMVFHQVNCRIISLLKKIFTEKGILFYDYSEISGNCGAATTGIILSKEEKNIKGRKVFICGFGTGGTITAGLWQF